MWTYAHHPRVPEKIRLAFQRFGLAKDEFAENGNWPRQLYVREARRMVSDYVMSEKNCRRAEVVSDSVGMGAYNMDSHHVQRYVTPEGVVRNEGDVQVGSKPYPISYRSIRPKASECTNLLVPVCLSASHIAYGSIRMEPVFMVLGQSAAMAAGLAIERGSTVQAVDYETLKERLLKAGQVLDFAIEPAAAARGIPTKNLPGIVLDDTEAALQGFDATSQASAGFVGAGYRHDDNSGKGAMSARFTPNLPKTGSYQVGLACLSPSGMQMVNPRFFSTKGWVRKEKARSTSLAPSSFRQGVKAGWRSATPVQTAMWLWTPSSGFPWNSRAAMCRQAGRRREVFTCQGWHRFFSLHGPDKSVA